MDMGQKVLPVAVMLTKNCACEIILLRHPIGYNNSSKNYQI